MVWNMVSKPMKSRQIWLLVCGTTSFAFSMRGHSFIFPLHHPISSAIYCGLAQPKNGPQFFIHPPVLSVCLELGLRTIHKWHWPWGRREWSIITQFYRYCYMNCVKCWPKRRWVQNHSNYFARHLWIILYRARKNGLYVVWWSLLLL